MDQSASNDKPKQEESQVIPASSPVKISPPPPEKPAVPTLVTEVVQAETPQPKTESVLAATTKDQGNQASAQPEVDPAQMQSLLNSLLAQPAEVIATPATSPPPPPPSPDQVVKPETVVVGPGQGQPVKPKNRSGGKALVIATMLILLFTIPVGVYYYFQRRENVYQESQAAPYPPTPSPTGTSRYYRIACNSQNQGFDVAANGDCAEANDPWSASDVYGRGFGCNDTSPAGVIMAHFVCDGLESSGQGCGYDNGRKIWEGSGTRTFQRDCGLEQIDTVTGWISVRHCVPCGEPTSPPGPALTPTPTPPGPSRTPTPTPPGPSRTPTRAQTPSPTPAQCLSLKCYNQSNNQIDPSTLKPKDKVTFGVLASTATKARFRINGSEFIETTRVRGTGMNREFVFPPLGLYMDGFYTIPDLTEDTTYKVEAEIFADGVWK